MSVLSRILHVGGGTSERELETHLRGSAAVHRERTGRDALDRLRDGAPVVCVVSEATLPDVPLEAFLERLRTLDPTVPILVVEDPNRGLDVAAALEAGATDVIRRRDPVDHGARSPLERRLDAIVGAVGRRPTVAADGAGTPSAGADGIWRPALRTLGETADVGLVAVFDDERRYVFATGTAGDLAPADLEGIRVADAFADEAAAYLDADYVATIDGERRRRELTIGGLRYEIETSPLRTADDRPAGGLTRFRMVGRAEPSPAASAGTREKVERLLEITSELETLESKAEIYELTVDFADRVLEFDACSISIVEDGRIVPQAATAPELQVAAEPMHTGEGIAGRTVAEHRSFLVADLRTDPDAKPVDERYRSVLSVPVSLDGVLQAVSTTDDAYTETDRELAELLVTHVEHALDRVEYEEAVTRERDRFAALFENVPDAVVQYVFEDGRPRIESVNAAFARLFGYDPAEAVGESVPTMLVTDDDREAAERLYEAVAEGDRLDREVERETTDGLNPFLLRSVPVAGVDEAAATEGYLIYTDIGTLKERERELQCQNERLDRFASVVSHDLRNPLNIAQGYVEMVQETGDVEHVGRIGTELDRIARMVEELLTLARKGAVIDDLEPIDLAEAAERAWQHVETGDATLTVGDLPTVEADPGRFEELLENLFRNSVEHGSTGSRTGSGPDDGGEHGGRDVAVEVDALDDGGIYVADDGTGVPDDIKDEILVAGFSTAEDGTGFGLAIVTDIAEAHGWDVRVTDSDTGGARFELTGMDVG